MGTGLSVFSEYRTRETRLSHVRFYGKDRLIADRGGLARFRSGRDVVDDEAQIFSRYAILVLDEEKNGVSAFGLASPNRNPGCHRK